MAISDSVRRLNVMLERRNVLEQKGAALQQQQSNLNNFVSNKWVTIGKQIDANYARIVKVNAALSLQSRHINAAAWQQMGNAISSAANSMVVASTALGALMVSSMAHWNPAMVTRFEQRLGDLAAVVGSILAPAFQELTDQVHAVSNWLLNLSPATKQLISDWAKFLVPITAVSLGLSGMVLLFRPLVTVGVAAVNLLTAAYWRLAVASTAANAAQSGGGWGGGKAKLIGAGLGAGAGAAFGSQWGTGGAVAGAIGGGVLGHFVQSAVGKILGVGLGTTMGTIAGKALWGAGSAATTVATSPLTGMAAIAGAGAMGIDYLANRNHKDRATYGEMWDSAGDVGINRWDNKASFGENMSRPFFELSPLRTKSGLSDERNAKYDKIVNAEREKLGLDPIGREGKKDSTGYDAARRATTMTSVLDVGRRMRESALTNAGRVETPTDKNTEGILALLQTALPDATAALQKQSNDDSKNAIS